MMEGHPENVATGTAQWQTRAGGTNAAICGNAQVDVFQLRKAPEKQSAGVEM
jgi:hypothetical protein